MSTIDARQVPVDATSAERLAARGLTYRSVDASSDEYTDYYRAVARGFLDAEPGEKELAAARDSSLQPPERLVGVYDDTETDGFPVGTVASWLTPLTIPGGTLDMWAISGVTVAGTHRRRGIARAMLEGELRAAAGAGVPIAGLTVTEATIYGRYGFGSAVPVVGLVVDAARAGWRSYEPKATVRYVSRERLAEAFAETGAAQTAVGTTPTWPGRRQEYAGTHPAVKDGEKIRGVVATDADGRVVGAMSYRLAFDGDYTKHTLTIGHIETVTPDAYAALWRFALSHDLVATVKARLQPVDGTLPFLVADPRAVQATPGDHVWLRILDLPRALEARTYSGEGTSHAVNAAGVLGVHDPLGFAHGTWRVEIEAGSARVFPTEMDADVELGIADLSAAFLGGTSLQGLADAGRVSGSASALERIDAALRGPRAPRHGFVF